MARAALEMARFADETEEDEVASAPEPFAESSDSIHLARAQTLQGGAEKVLRQKQKEDHGQLPLSCSRHVPVIHQPRCVKVS